MAKCTIPKQEKIPEHLEQKKIVERIFLKK